MDPRAVTAELCHARTPAIVRRWAGQLPSWVEVQRVDGLPTAHELAGLDRGEWEAIELAKRIEANLLLIDERAGVQVARAQGFTVTGTLGVLVEAARSGLASIDEALARLAQTGFSQDSGFVRPDAGTCTQVRSRLKQSAALPMLLYW